MWWAYTIAAVLLLVAIGLGACACIRLPSLSDSVRDIRDDLQKNYVREYDLQRSAPKQMFDSSPDTLIPVDPRKPVGPCPGGPCAPVDPCDPQCNLPKDPVQCTEFKKKLEINGNFVSDLKWENGECRARHNFPLDQKDCDHLNPLWWKPDPDKCASILPFPP